MESLRSLLPILGMSTSLLACQAKVPGTYELDFEQTKLAVQQAVERNPDERQRQAEALELLQATRLIIRLHEGGKMETTTELTNRAAPTPPPRHGQWKQQGQKVIMSVHNEDPDAHAHAKDPDTECSIDGKRLRCFKPMPQKLFENYVLVRKD